MKDLSRSPTSRGVGVKLEITGVESVESTRQSDKVFVRCKRCGTPVNQAKHSRCPYCEIENYWKVNN